MPHFSTKIRVAYWERLKSLIFQQKVLLCTEKQLHSIYPCIFTHGKNSSSTVSDNPHLIWFY